MLWKVAFSCRSSHGTSYDNITSRKKRPNIKDKNNHPSCSLRASFLACLWRALTLSINKMWFTDFTIQCLQQPESGGKESGRPSFSRASSWWIPERWLKRAFTWRKTFVEDNNSYLCINNAQIHSHELSIVLR